MSLSTSSWTQPTAKPAASAALRSHRIDLMRGVAILLVLLHHFSIAYSLDDTSPALWFGADALHALARNGNYGVTMFFVVSGYLITSNASRRWPGLVGINAGAFYALRVARVLPALLLLLAAVNLLALLGIEIFQNHGDDSLPVSFWTVNLASLGFWMNVLIVSRGWVNYALGVLWSLSVEEVFYLSFPLLCLLLRRKSNDWQLPAFWTLIILVGPLYRFTHQGDEERYLYDYFAAFDGIAVGCCTAMLAGRIRFDGSKAKIVQWVVLAAMACLYLCWPISQANVFGVSAMAFGTAVLLLGTHHRPVEQSGRSWAAGGLAWCGRLSYELYLFHLIVLGLIRTAFPPGEASGDVTLLLLVLFLAVSFAMAAAIARYYSEPLNLVIRRLLASRPKQ